MRPDFGRDCNKYRGERMKGYVGIWIDREKAFVVSIAQNKDAIARIESNVEGHVRLAGGSRSATLYGPQDVASERKIEDRRRHHLRRYYQKIVKAIGGAEEIVIFGPGKAKIELEKEIGKTRQLASRVVGVLPADKMTERQIKAKVREFFVSKG